MIYVLDKDQHQNKYDNLAKSCFDQVRKEFNKPVTFSRANMTEDERSKQVENSIEGFPHEPHDAE